MHTCLVVFCRSGCFFLALLAVLHHFFGLEFRAARLGLRRKDVEIQVSGSKGQSSGLSRVGLWAL